MQDGLAYLFLKTTSCRHSKSIVSIRRKRLTQEPRASTVCTSTMSTSTPFGAAVWSTHCHSALVHVLLTYLLTYFMSTTTSTSTITTSASTSRRLIVQDVGYTYYARRCCSHHVFGPLTRRRSLVVNGPTMSAKVGPMSSQTWLVTNHHVTV